MIIKIAVVSDIVCPWCYIGKRRLENAIREISQEIGFEIAYYPFELNPDAPPEGRNNRLYLIEKFGGEDSWRRLTDNVTRVAAGEGIEFNYERQAVLPNTRNAHRLLLYSREEGRQSELAEALFRAYFTDGIDLTRTSNLANIAAGVGMDREKAELFLNSTAGTAEVAEAETELQRLGIRGVPFYIINDRYGISGAQNTSTFIELFRSIAKKISEHSA